MADDFNYDVFLSHNSKNKLEFTDVRWMEISGYLRRESKGGKKPVKQIVFQFRSEIIGDDLGSDAYSVCSGTQIAFGNFSGTQIASRFLSGTGFASFSDLTD